MGNELIKIEYLGIIIVLCLKKNFSSYRKFLLFLRGNEIDVGTNLLGTIIKLHAKYYDFMRNSQNSQKRTLLRSCVPSGWTAGNL